MSFHWLKRYMPRGLYGRAALILVLPVVTLQLVVSVVFIQRHFEGVTEQLTQELSRSVNLSLDSFATTGTMPSGLRVRLERVDTLPEQDALRWYDLSGRIVIRELRDNIPSLARIVLPNQRVILMWLERDGVLYRTELDRERASASNPHQLLVNMVFFGGLMTLIAFVYLRNQLRPITQLAGAAEAFGRGQTVPYSPSGATEVRSAGHAFLNMRARIERHIEQRTMMLSGVSHDLRTPLTRMRLGLSLLDSEESAPLERDVDEMQALIDAFLDFARADAEHANAEPTDPVALVQQIVEDARRGGQTVSLSAPPDQGMVPLRPGALRRAVENLVRNAHRYGTTCHVSVALNSTVLRIRVEDDGPGIPADKREDALRPFVRLDPSRNQDRGSGVGLGLAIASDIARVHGGVLRLGESEDLGGLRAEILIAVQQVETNSPTQA